jgi:hypothetical protein
MERKFDIVTTACAGCVAGYVAVIVGYLARFYLGFSPQEIRGAAVVIAVVLAALIAIDFFGKKLRKAK